MPLPNQVTDSGPVDRNFRDLDSRLEALEAVLTVISTIESLKVIRGTVNTAGSGSIVVGSGFSIARNGTGDVTVTFTAAFSDVPTVVLGSNRDEVFHGAAPTTTTCRPNTANTSGVATDGTFQFLAIGPA